MVRWMLPDTAGAAGAWPPGTLSMLAAASPAYVSSLPPGPAVSAVSLASGVGVGEEGVDGVAVEQGGVHGGAELADRAGRAAGLEPPGEGGEPGVGG